MAGTMGDTVRSFADLHCHTSASFDSLSKPEQVARALCCVDAVMVRDGQMGEAARGRRAPDLLRLGERIE